MSLEYIITIGLLLMFITPLMYFSFSTFDTASKVYNAEMMVSRLVESADSVYAQGWPSQQSILILFPESIADITIFNKTVVVKVQISNSNTSVLGTSKGCIMGNLTASSGLKNILIRAESNTCVNITEAV
jgi:hypothetical protein